MCSNKRGGRAKCVASTNCRHHWMVDSTESAIAKAICSVCGQERRFANEFRPATPRPQRLRIPEPSGNGNAEQRLWVDEILP